ncbi:MAG TPA: aryl-sulfate sulfotransferase [Acidobacteriaceae bacterium]|nr:aryl-sulfate sulfotransferase [Acidobacteriaceae bacterium]
MQRLQQANKFHRFTRIIKSECIFKAIAVPVGGLSLFALCLGCGNNSLGYVAGTNNPQVAVYTITPPKAGSVTIEFGKTTSYGLHTWTQQTPPGGGPVSIYVAGMLANTTYHMRADVQYGDGTTFTDTDHTFTTGSYPAALIPQLKVTTTPGQTPQPGIEILNPISAAGEVVATDLSGNVVWMYSQFLTGLGGAQWYAPKLLPDGNFVALAALGSTAVLTPPLIAGAANLVREFDLAGNTIKQITMAQLNARLAAANYNLTLQVFHHDVTVLPNGHWLVLANTLKNVVLTGQTTPTQVLGDVIIDLDTNLKPVWVWNEFDHLDVNRHPWMFPDWTHTNAVVYSPDDGNIIVSIRHQNWVLKVDYNNGAGTGNILWHLGEGGDFKLVGGTDPTDWNYAQHAPSFTTSNTSGIFGLTLMDNGDDRMYPGGTTVTCGGTGTPACYSTIPIFQINESAMTATFKFHQILPPALYNNFGGNAETLANGDVEYDLCGLSSTNSEVLEVTNSSNPQTVWSMTSIKNYLYRAYRLPSLYPGVQW